MSFNKIYRNVDIFLEIFHMKGYLSFQFTFCAFNKKQEV